MCVRARWWGGVIIVGFLIFVLKEFLFFVSGLRIDRNVNVPLNHREVFLFSFCIPTKGHVSVSHTQALMLLFFKDI